MPGEWTTKPVSEIEVGATVRLADGRELVVSRIEHDFFGMASLTALIEDTPRQWFKAPVPSDGELEVLAPD